MTSSSQEDVTRTLEKLREQNRRLAKHQEASYKWHLQHHANLKNVITALNRLAELLNEKLAAGGYPLEVQEDKSLLSESTLGFQPPDIHSIPDDFTTPAPPSYGNYSNPKSVVPTPSIGPVDLHQLVMRYRNNLQNDEFQNRLRNVNEDEFNTLQGIFQFFHFLITTESSCEIILPLITSWMESATYRLAGVIYLYESAMKFPQIFSRPSAKKLTRQCRDVVSMLITDRRDYGLSKDELKSLFTFLNECLM
ncbi:hypothetical protein RCL1_001695 [Eukaryota sp. TZLM3-RCL]